MGWRDKYTKKAQKEDKRARSAYKLEEINKKYSVIKKKDCVLDLGCFPGGWMIISQKIVGTEGRVVGVDQKKIEPIKNAEFVQGDVFEEKTLEKIRGEFDAVISDLAPKTTGIHIIDVEKSVELANKSLKIARRFLKNHGNFVCKVFVGEGFDSFIKNFERYFRFVKTFKPQSSRRESREAYVICLRYYKPNDSAN
ncbi:RlmE family RNA methyltransferase [Candidatus Woesearchaeota archaeon]|nr:RlmE family RNA methyltransferase [Candidatus Woesearchaeota archaeon]